MQKVLLEVCCGSCDDVAEAWKAGADRVELNSSLFQGGLTPSIGALIASKSAVPIPIMAMVRPRAGGFCYTPMEFRTALLDAEKLLEHGADGLVFGILNGDGTVDAQRTRELVRLAGDRPTVFHRALDVTPDWKRALDTLIDLGIRRVLTSGQAPSAFYAMDTLAEMIRYVGGAMEILPGGGVNLRNAAQIIEATSCTQIHLAHHRKIKDTSTANNRDIFFGGALYPPEDQFDQLDGAYIASMRELTR
ncbi:MAG TPA: copper homeostasis protein CutC [Candidatus Limiplasma sp.]|nr:copper homeostasis protein CutC [Candidatus Limiplasma sp.]HPS80429.1 copper homeostasis protein CutC [Candidatus Limiplasma sp.]